MNAVSLFAGVGGFDLALERAGVPVVAAVEIDKAARGVLAHQFPNTKLFGDIQEVSGNDLLGAGFVPDQGIIVGGFPCQDLSVAGRRAGLAGERSGLFWEIVRLVDDLQPRWIILENVPGLLSSNKGRDMGIVLGTLAECGYGVAYRVLDAQYFGVPQRRRRVFIVGCLGDNGRAPAEVLALSESLLGDSASSNAKGKETARRAASGSTEQVVTGPVTTGMSSPRGTENIESHHYVLVGGSSSPNLYEPKSAFEENWAESEVKNALRAGASKSSHAVVWNKAKRAQTPEDDESWVEGGVTPTLNQFDAGDTRSTTVVAADAKTGEPIIYEDHRSDSTLRVNEGISPTLTARMGTGGNNVPLTDLELGEQLIAFSHTQGLDCQASEVATPTLRKEGGGAAVMVGVDTYNGTTTGDIAHTLRDGHSEGTPAVQSLSAVRRLTPVECERLQGFPDDWTLYRIDPKKGLIEQADSSRYKQMGNAVAVPCVEWIVNRLVEQA